MPASNSPHLGKILLDMPSATPALGFDRTAQALTQLITESQPRFAIGVFGDWGSGKTTLMEAIKRHLELDDSIVIVTFNAWRFERELQLLVPLLDTVRAAVVKWSSTRDISTREQVRRVAARISKVVRALASGLSGEVGLPGSVKISYDVGRAIEVLSDGLEQPQSLYVAAFQELSEAFDQLLQIGASRVVVFVDDLDRCLPASALEVLESMKLFFDLQGFVFVVGLDKKVVQRAVRARFMDTLPPSGLGVTESGEGQGSQVTNELERLELDYIDKIFQVPYYVPPMLADDLRALLHSMFREARLGDDQKTDFNDRVRPYLYYVAVDRRVNPREVKRFLNAYTVQTSVRPDLNRDAVLALQTLTFRPSWQTVYDAILTDSVLFVNALKRYRNGEDSAFADIHPELAVIPADLADYLRSKCVEALCRQTSLDKYLSSLESTGRMPRVLDEAYQVLGRLRSVLRKALTGPAPTQASGNEVVSVAKEVTALLQERGLDTVAGPVSRIQPLLEDINRLIESLASGLRSYVDRSADATGQEIRQAAKSIYDLTDQLYRELRSLRRVEPSRLNP